MAKAFLPARGIQRFFRSCRVGVSTLLFVVCLVSCNIATTAPQPTATPPLQPILSMPTAYQPVANTPSQSNDSLPTVEAQSTQLAGRLLFVQGGNLWVWQADRLQQLTHTGDSFQPAWSPDGQQIAYIQRTISSSELMVMPSSGGTPQQLTEDGPDSSVYSYDRIYSSLWAFYPAWSPDGSTIAYASQAGPPGGSPAAEYRVSLFDIPAAGGRRTQLYGDNSGHVGRLAYAPDGQSIVFAYGPAGQGAPTLHRYMLASGGADPLPGAPEQSYDPVWSPDGRWIAFAARVDGKTDIFALPVNATDNATSIPIRLTHHGAARAPAWSPDGQHLAFLAVVPGSNTFALWVVDLRGSSNRILQAGEPRQLIHDMTLDADSGISWAR